MTGSDILVLGATGRTGRMLVSDLRRRGAAVRALVRNEAHARGEWGDGVRLIAGDLRDREALARAAAGCDRIVFVAAANGGSGRGTPREIDFGAVRELVEALDANAVTRFVLLSSAAVTQPEHPHNCSFSSVLKWKLRGEDAVRSSRVPYTIVRALGLRDRPGGGQGVRVVQGDRIAFGEDIARADVAAFLADILAPPEAAEPGLDVDTLRNATCEIFNDATVPGGQRVSARHALRPDGRPLQLVTA